MSEPSPEIQSWAEWIRQRELSDLAHLLLAVVEPIGPLGAQALLVIQPVSRIFGWEKAIGDLAHILEQPDGVEQLRHQLNQEPIKDETNDKLR